MKSCLAWIPILLTTAVLWGEVEERPTDEVQTEMIVPWMEASELALELRMREGNLILSGGADELLRSVFTHQEGQKRPSFTLFLDEGEAGVELESKGRGEQWEIYVTEKIPVYLKVDTHTGNQRIDLSGVQVQAFMLDAHTGNTAVVFGGDQKEFDTVKVNHRVGNVDLEFTGRYHALKEVELEAGTGEVRVDLSGAWLTPAKVQVEVESGNVSLVVPKQQGASIEVGDRVGEVVTKAGIYAREARHYVNQAYETADVPLEIVIDVGRGNVFIQEN